MGTIGKGIKYYGRKTEVNLLNCLNLLPAKPIDCVVDCCFGSGNFTRIVGAHLGCGRVIGYEKEKALYILHCQIRDNPELLLEAIGKMPQKKDVFEKCKSIVMATNKGAQDFSDLAVAVAENYIIYNSHNNDRRTMRNMEAYKKYNKMYSRLHSQQEIKRICNGYYKQHTDIYGMSQVWKGIELKNGDFREDLEIFLKNEASFLYMDLPYLFKKRGRENNQERKGSEYFEDWKEEDHLELIERLKHERKAKIMICSNFEIDEQGEVIGLATDPYSDLLQNGWKMFVTESKHSSRIISKNGQVRKRKAEVVYINYEPIHADVYYKVYDVSDL